MAPDFERLARTPWPIASLASSGIGPLSSTLAFSCSRKAARVERKTLANSAQAIKWRNRRAGPRTIVCRKSASFFADHVKPLLHWLHREVRLIPAALRQAEPGDDPCVTIVIPSGVVLENCCRFDERGQR